MQTSASLLQSLLKKRKLQQQADSMQSSEALQKSQPTISKSEFINEFLNEFNPLLRNEPKSQSALTACAKLLYIHPEFPAGIMWREFSEWLGGYEYIMPADRKILDDLAILSIRKIGWNRFSKLQYTIYSNFSETTQKELILWLSTPE